MLPALAWAIGLGDIQVSSALNQQLNAKIDIVDLGSQPLQSLNVVLAPEQQFEAVGLKRDPELSVLQFTVERDANQQPIINITSTQPITQPVLTFLIQLNWVNGQVLREYTIFLDPINYAASSPVSAQPAATKSTSAAVKPLARPTLYGPTKANESFWQIAQKTRPSMNVTTTQNMVSMFQLNPTAFVRNNINGLKVGVMLILPTESQALAISNDKARAILAEQNQAWQSQTVTTSSSGTAPAPVEPLVLPPTAIEPTTTETTTETESENETTIGNQAANVSLSEANASPMSTENNSLSPASSLEQETETSASFSAQNAPQNMQEVLSALAATKQAMQVSTQANIILQSEVTSLQQQIKKLNEQLITKQKEVDTLERLLAKEQRDHAINTLTTQTVTTQPGGATGGAIVPPETRPWYVYPLIILLLIMGLLAGIFVPWRNLREKLNHLKLSSFSIASIHKALTDWIEAKATKARKVIPRETAIDLPIETNVTSAHVTSIAEATEPTSKSPTENQEKLTSTKTEAAYAPPISLIDEASVYMAYGRYEQAESLLKAGLTQSPDQPDVLLKLLDVYVNQKNAPQYEATLAKLTSLASLPPFLQETLNNLNDQWQSQVDVAEAAIKTEKNAEEALLKEANRKEESRVIEFDGDWLKSKSTQVEEPPKPAETVMPSSAPWESLLDNLTLEDNVTIEKASVQISVAKDAISQESAADDVFPEETTNETRLDLAKAYIDMDDFEEATKILQEIVQEGNDSQKQTAQNLIEQIQNSKK